MRLRAGFPGGRWLATLSDNCSLDFRRYLLKAAPSLVAYRLTTKDIPLESGAQEAITKDNAVIVANAIAFIKIIDPVKAVYGISNYEYAIQNLVMTSLRAIIGEMELDLALSSRDIIKAWLKEIISDERHPETLHLPQHQELHPAGGYFRCGEGDCGEVVGILRTARWGRRVGQEILV